MSQKLMSPRQVVVCTFPLLLLAGCGSVVAGSPEQSGFPAYFEIVDWPDTLVQGDSALARVRVTDQAGSPGVSVSYAWAIDPVSVAGLHGAGAGSQRRVLAFRPGVATLRVIASASTGSCTGGGYTPGFSSTMPNCTTRAVFHVDSARPVVVLPRP